MSRRLITNERTIWYGRGQATDLPWTGTRYATFGSGREAMLTLLDSLGARPGDRILLPAFVPEGLIAPCRVRALDVALYPVDHLLDPDWQALESVASAQFARLAVLVHFFGVQRDAERFVSICHAHGTLVMEDLAQAHALPESLLGSAGDFVLHSLPKIVGVPDGAVLVIRANVPAPLARPHAGDLRRALALAMNSGRLLANVASRRIGSWRFWSAFNRVAGRLLNSYRLLMWYFQRPTPMSRLTALLLSRFPWRAAVVRRQALERRYREGLDAKTFQPLLDGAERAHCAMGYPVLVEARDALIAALARHGIHGIWFEQKWDYFPSGTEHDAGRWAMRHHFLFPTAYALTRAEVDEVIRVANEWASEVHVHPTTS